jgi:hypothetical protein
MSIRQSMLCKCHTRAAGHRIEPFCSDSWNMSSGMLVACHVWRCHSSPALALLGSWWEHQHLELSDLELIRRTLLISALGSCLDTDE